jgi:archaellum component FlaC
MSNTESIEDIIAHIQNQIGILDGDRVTILDILKAQKTQNGSIFDALEELDQKVMVLTKLVEELIPAEQKLRIMMATKHRGKKRK